MESLKMDLSNMEELEKLKKICGSGPNLAPGIIDGVPENMWSYCLMHSMIMKGSVFRVDALRYFVETLHVDINTKALIKGIDEGSAFMGICLKNKFDVDMLKYCVEVCSADIYDNFCGLLALDMFCFHIDKDLLEYLVGTLNVDFSRNMRAFACMCIENCSLDILKYSMEVGNANLNSIYETNYDTAFLKMCYYSDVNGFNMDILKYCIEMGGDLNIVNISNVTSFQALCDAQTRNGQMTMDMLKYCIEVGGADLNIKNVYCTSAFTVLCKQQVMSLEMLKYCVEVGKADIHQITSTGNTPFTWMCKNGIDDITMEYCIGLGCDVNHKNKEGKTALDLLNECKDKKSNM